MSLPAPPRRGGSRGYCGHPRHRAEGGSPREIRRLPRRARALQAQGIGPELEMSPNVVGLEPDRLAERGGRLVELALLLQGGERELAVGDESDKSDSGGSPRDVRRRPRRIAASLLKGDPQPVMGLEIFGRKAIRVTIQRSPRRACALLTAGTRLARWRWGSTRFL